MHRKSAHCHCDAGQLALGGWSVYLGNAWFFPLLGGDEKNRKAPAFTVGAFLSAPIFCG
jgi:hypothetical protein